MHVFLLAWRRKGARSGKSRGFLAGIPSFGTRISLEKLIDKSVE
jgi:hypothetical protein